VTRIGALNAAETTAAGIAGAFARLAPRLALGATVATAALLRFWDVLSVMGTFERRYLETLAPGLAGVLGVAGAVCLGAAATREARRRAVAVAAIFVLAVALTATAARSIRLVDADGSDGGAFGHMRARDVAALSRYLTAHRDGARYEFATLSASWAGPLIAADAQPVLVLAASPYRPLVSVGELQRAVAAGEVRYVLMSRKPTVCGPHVPSGPPSRRRIVAWIEDHGTDVTQQAGLRGCGVLLRVGPAPRMTGAPAAYGGGR
jgi:hypothetical protein